MARPDSPPSITVPELRTSDVAAMSDEELMELAAESSRQMASLAGRIVLLAAELDRREGWRAEGATSLESWLVERCGVSTATARTWAHVGQRLFDLPHLARSLTSGNLSFDKVRAVSDLATPETDAELSQRARACSVRQLVELGRSRRAPGEAKAETDYEVRTVRFNDACRTVTAQLPLEAYAEVRGRLEARAKDLPSDGRTRWDRRLCDALLQLVRGGGAPSVPATTPSPYLVVVHVPLEALREESAGSSGLCGQLERGGLLSTGTVQRIVCDSTVVLAVDDDVGHTMYEGRARRVPTGAQRREIRRRDQHCRFPGCTNATFTDVHHVVPWATGRGRTDLDNLVTLCEHHHHQVHSHLWSMSGDANTELTFVGPSGREMTSRPSVLWTVASARS